MAFGPEVRLSSDMTIRTVYKPAEIHMQDAEEVGNRKKTIGCAEIRAWTNIRLGEGLVSWRNS